MLLIQRTMLNLSHVIWESSREFVHVFDVWLGIFIIGEVIHRIRQNAHENDAFIQAGQLPYAERPPQHAHVQIKACHQHRNTSIFH